MATLEAAAVARYLSGRLGWPAAAARVRCDAADDQAFRARFYDVLRIIEEREVTLAVRAS